jgi:hypothetical protein
MGLRPAQRNERRSHPTRGENVEVPECAMLRQRLLRGVTSRRRERTAPRTAAITSPWGTRSSSASRETPFVVLARGFERGDTLEVRDLSGPVLRYVRRGPRHR